MDKFKNKYHIKSIRLHGYDYGQNGAYFINICTKNRECFFGNIIDGRMQYFKLGEIACECWQCIPEHFPFVKLGEWVVMPNHVHGIIVIDKNNLQQNIVETRNNDVGKRNNYVGTQNDDVDVEIQNFVSLRPQQHNNKFGPQSKNLASIIRGFKIGVTKYARKNTDIFDVWQPKFYDHIIRNEKSYQKISRYIINNPINWQKDKLYYYG